MEEREWGGEQGMVGSGGGEGVNAYPMEYKMTTTITSSSSSPVRLRRLVPRRRMRHGPARPLRRSWLWGRGVPVVFACGRWSSFDSRWGRWGRFRRCWAVALVRRALVCWGLAVVSRSLSSLPAFFESLGGWRRFGRTALWCCRWRDVACGRHAPVLLMLVTWACGCRVCWLAGCRVLWATWVASGGGVYLWVGWWHGALVVVEVVVVG